MLDATPLTTAALLLTLDLIGTFAFAVSGAASGVKSRLDVFGVSILAFVAGNAGGVTRDVLIGAVPPAAITLPSLAAASRRRHSAMVDLHVLPPTTGVR